MYQIAADKVSLSLMLSCLMLLTSCGKGQLEGLDNFLSSQNESGSFAPPIAMAIDDQSSDTNAYHLWLSVPQSYQKAYLCNESTKNNCAAGRSSGDYNVTLMGQKGSKNIFKTSQPLSLRENLTFFVSAVDAQGNQITQTARIISAQSENIAAKPLNLGAEPTSNYYKVSSIKAMLRNWANENAQLMRYEKYASSGEQEFFYLRVSPSVNDNTPRAKVLITGATHGDEWLSTATVLGFMHQFLSKYGKDATVTDLIKNRDIYFVPVVCPNNYSAVSRYTQGIDPNRAFPLPGQNTSQGAPACTTAIKQLYDKIKFDAVVDYHAAGRVMMYPWSYTSSSLRDKKHENKFRNLLNNMAKTASYRYGTPYGMLRYLAPGSSMDYYYSQGQKNGANTVAMAVEVGAEKIPHPSTIATEVNRNYRSLFTFISSAPGMFSQAAGFAAEEEISLPVYSENNEEFPVITLE